VTTKLLYFVSHPIQYQAPLLRQISNQPDIDLNVVFEADYSEGRYFDTGFGVELEWDIPLRSGYKNHLLSEIDAAQYLKKADVVWFHGWQSRRFKNLLKLAKKIGTPVLLRGENWEGAMPDGVGVLGWLKRRYLSQIFSKCSAFLAIGSVNRRYYIDHGIFEQKIFDVPYAVDNSFFGQSKTDSAALDFRQEFGIPENRKIILFAGKLTARKKPDVLLKAWSEAAWTSGERPSLVFVGDGELKQSLMASAERSDMKEDIIFTGFRNQTELPAIYQAADVFVLSSEKEPWGLAINEAMASGTAVIASDQCGAAFDLLSNETGAIVKAGDISELAGALVSVIGRSDEMGRAARRRIENWDFEADIAGLKLALDFVR